MTIERSGVLATALPESECDPLILHMETVKNTMLRISTLALHDPRVDAYGFMEFLAACLHADRGMNSFATSIELASGAPMTEDELRIEAEGKQRLLTILHGYMPLEHATVARHKQRQKALIDKLEQQLALMKSLAG